MNDHPFLHTVIDDLIPPRMVRLINEEWPADEASWHPYNHKYSQKRACFNPELFGFYTREQLSVMNSAAYTRMLGAQFGLLNLVSDPMLFGGGLHESFAGGFLSIHADFNIHPQTKLIRRLNLLLFLNEDWREEYGGNLELWDGEKCCESIAPIAGRCVIFETTNRSFHGHPTPMTCGDRSRRSIALYYYSPAMEGEQVVEHSTLYIEDKGHWPAGV